MSPSRVLRGLLRRARRSLRRRTATVGARRLPESPREVRRLHHLTTVDREARLLALTFDDGPFRDRTVEVLDILAQHDVPATFFMVGRRAEAHPGIVHRVVAAGHTVASHAYVHRDLVELSTRRIQREIGAAKVTLERISGREVALFRPPHSSRDERVTAATHAAGQWLVHWTISVNDGRRTAAEIVATVRERLVPNAIILLHELPQTIEALPTIIAEARAAGYTFVALPPGRPLKHHARVGRHAVRRLGSVTRQHTAGEVVATRRRMPRAVLVGEDLGPAEAAAVAYAIGARAVLVPVRPERIPVPMQAHLERLRPEGALVIGDAAVLGPEVVDHLHRWTPSSERLDHGEAFELAMELASRLPPSPVVVVTTTADPCTLSAAASLAGRLRAPLVPLRSEGPRPAETRWLSEQRPQRVVVIGDPGGPPCDELRGTGATLTHVSGSPHAVAEDLARHFPARGVWITASRPGPDLVAAAAAAAQDDAVLLFADEVSADSTGAVARALAGDTVTIVGGRAAVPDDLVAAILAPKGARTRRAAAGALRR